MDWSPLTLLTVSYHVIRQLCTRAPQAEKAICVYGKVGDSWQCDQQSVLANYCSFLFTMLTSLGQGFVPHTQPVSSVCAYVHMWLDCVLLL